MDHYPILAQALLLDDRLTREGHEMNAMYCIQVRSELIPHKSNNTHEIQTFSRFFILAAVISASAQTSDAQEFRDAWTGQGVGLVL